MKFATILAGRQAGRQAGRRKSVLFPRAFQLNIGNKAALPLYGINRAVQQ